MLKNKKILLAVCGSISFYKAFELLSMLKKAGADVYVMLSNGALNFINHKAFEALCKNRVLCEKTEDWQSGLNHINYSKMDLVVIAPASVNTINKLAHGICDNVFMQTLIASKAPFIIAPSANNAMLENQATKNSLEILRSYGATIIPPVTKMLACGDIGKGALAPIEDIFMKICQKLNQDEFYVGKTVLITAGPTIEKIDDVRAITNLSSGRMGKALADAFYLLGANVILITSVSQEAPYKIIKFESSIGLQSAIDSQKLKPNDILIMAAAVSDYIPIRISGKIKKDDFDEILNFKFKKNADILSNINFPGIIKVGFKLEADEEEAVQNANKMLKQKHLNAVCLNILSETVKFGSKDTKITFITKNKTKEFELQSKEAMAFEIAKLIKEL